MSAECGTTERTIYRDMKMLEGAGIPYFYDEWDREFKDFCRKVSRSKPTTDRPAVEQRYPTIADFVRNRGHIEVGDQEGFGFVARAIDCGGLVFEARKVMTLARAMAALEAGLADRRDGGSDED